MYAESVATCYFRMSAELRAIRERMFAEDAKCHWCRRETEPPPKDAARIEGWYATVDHLFPRGHPLREVQIPGIQRYVLSCARCNTERGVKQARHHRKRQSILAPQYGIWSHV